MTLTRIEHPSEPLINTPITVALIQQGATVPTAPEAPLTPPAPPAPPAPIAPPPEPVIPLEPAPPPAKAPVVPPPEPPPQVVPAPPKPPQPPPKKKAVVAPKPVTEAPTAIVQQETPPPSPLPSPPTPAALATPLPHAMPTPAAPTQTSPNSAPTAVTNARYDAAYLNNPAPAYPALSRRMREQGRVLLRVFVTAEGRAGRIELSESSGSSRLDGAAEAAVARWRFVPARQGEQNVDAWVIVPIVFKLEGH